MKFIAAFVILSAFMSCFAAVGTRPATTEVERLQQEVTTLQAQIADLQHQLADARGGKVATTKPATIKPMTDIERAITGHQIIAGMSIEEVNKSLGSRGYSSRPPYSIQDGAPMEWNITDAGAGVPLGRYRVLFTKDGKVVRWEKQ